MRSLLATLLLLLAAAPALAIDDEHRARARAMIDKATAYLLARQGETGGWNVNPDGPTLPAITGLVVNGLLLDEQAEDNADAKGSKKSKGSRS